MIRKGSKTNGRVEMVRIVARFPPTRLLCERRAKLNADKVQVVWDHDPSTLLDEGPCGLAGTMARGWASK